MKNKRTVNRNGLKKTAIVLSCLSVLTINSGRIGYAQDSTDNYSYEQEHQVLYTLLTNNEEVEATKNDYSSTSFNSVYAETVEEEIQLEEWMLDSKDEFWKEIRMKLNEEEVEEEEIELEDWMIDLSYWQ